MVFFVVDICCFLVFDVCCVSIFVVTFVLNFVAVDFLLPLQAEVAGGKPLRTKKVTLTGERHRLNPEWRSELWQPVTVPCMSGSIKVRLPPSLLFSCVCFVSRSFFWVC